MSSIFPIAAVAALAALPLVLQRGSAARRGRRSPIGLRSVAGFIDQESADPDALVLRLPDGRELPLFTLMDTRDFDPESELGWLLFQGEDGAAAQRRLDRLTEWLDSLTEPLKVYRGMQLRPGEAVRRQRGGQHWTTSYDVARRFALGGSGYHEGAPHPRGAPGAVAAVAVAELDRLDDPQIDWMTSAYWFLSAGDDAEREVFVSQDLGRRLMVKATVREI